MYQVHTSQKAEQFLKKLDQHIRKRIEERLKKLGANPIPSDAKFIGRDEENEKIFRYRVGDFRVLYKVKDTQKVVLVAKVDKRPRIYDR